MNQQLPPVVQLPLCNKAGQLCVLISAEENGGRIQLFNTESGKVFVDITATSIEGGGLSFKDSDGHTVEVDAKGAAAFRGAEDEAPVQWP